MNQPYVKEYDENGKLKNPIKKSYPQPFENRIKRREKEARFMHNRKGFNMVVHKTTAYHKQLQYVVDKEGKLKTILHYVPKINKLN